MDSGNSGSIQSSSGGDEEFDSRAESSLSAFLNNPPPPTRVGPFTSNHPHHNTHVFDPLSNYLDPTQRSASSLVNLDMVWSKPARSDSNPADLGGLIVPSSSAQNQQAAIFSSQLAGQTRGVGAFPTTHHSLPPERGLLSMSAANDQQPHHHHHHNNNNSNLVRNPKKRSRASRRAPTTVLTTDTTNFRAMVQEFTGIPAPPFTSSPFPRSRLDLFGNSSIRSGNTHLDPPPPPYLLRPFAQKIQPPPHPLIPPSTANSTPINYHLSSSSADDLLKQPLMHNPILSFQSILQQAPPKYPLGNPPVLASKNQPTLEIPPAADSHLRMGVFEELGLNHAHASALHRNNIVSSSISDGALSGVDNNNNMRDPSTEWARAQTQTQKAGAMANSDGDNGGLLVRSLNATAIGNYTNINPAERVTNGKVNYSASSSDFHGDKGPDCAVTARSEGMVESWINCSD